MTTFIYVNLRISKQSQMITHKYNILLVARDSAKELTANVSIIGTEFTFPLCIQNDGTRYVIILQRTEKVVTPLPLGLILL